LKLGTILLVGLILISASVISCGGTQDSDTVNLDSATYSNWTANFVVDYPVDWNVTEFGNYISICPPGEFSMSAEINISTQDAPNGTWLTTKPTWCEGFQIEETFKNQNRFTGYYGWTPIYGRICQKNINDEIITIIPFYSQNLSDCSASQIPIELSLILDSLKPIDRDTFFIPEYEPLQPPPPIVDPEQIYIEYMIDKVKADDKYHGKRIWFSEVTVEKVINIIAEANPESLNNPLPQLKSLPQMDDIGVQIGPLFFKLRSPITLLTIREGCIVDILGEVRGLENDYLIIQDCTIWVLEGSQDAVW
jgi:hypothetical protein